MQSGAAASLPAARLASFYFFYFSVLGALLPYWPLYLQSLGLNPKEIGVLAALLVGTKIIAPNVWGWLADRGARRMRIIRVGAALACACFAGIFVDQSFVWLAIVVVSFSFFWNAVLPQFEVVTLSHLQDRFHDYSRIRLWGSVGFIIPVAALGFVFDVISITWLPIILCALLASIFLSSLTIPAREAVRTAQSAKRIGAVLKQPHVLAFFCACFLIQLSHGPYYTFFSLHLEQYGYDKTLTGLLWGLGVLAEIALFWKIASLFARFGLRNVLLASFFLAGLRWLLIAGFTDNLLLLIVAQCLHAASFGSFHAVSIELIRRFFKDGNEGRGQALYSSISFGAGGAVGALLAGLWWSVSPTGSFLAAATVCFLAILIIIYWIRDENLV
ncbi:MAG: MFS transporter [Pseudomonadales bacterium]